MEADSRPPLPVILATFAVIGANIYSIHKWTWSVAGWWDLFTVPMIVGAVSVPVGAIGWLLYFKRRTSTEPVPPAAIGASLIALPIGVSFFMLVFTAFIPFWVNTWSIEPRGHVQVQAGETEVSIVSDDPDSQDTGMEYRVVGTNTDFEFGGYSFNINTSEMNRKTFVEFEVYEGWLGWEFLGSIGAE